MFLVPKIYYAELCRLAAEAGVWAEYDHDCILEALNVVVDAGLRDSYASNFILGAMVVAGERSFRELPVGLFAAITLEAARPVAGWTFLAPSLPDSGIIDDVAALALLAGAVAPPANDNEAAPAMYPLMLTHSQTTALRAFAARYELTERAALAVVFHIGLRSARRLISDAENATGA